MTEESVLRIPAKLEGMDLILSFVSFLLDSHGCSPQARTQLRMAVEELYVNVTLYAYPDQDGWAEIRGSVKDGVATFVLIDGGTPFDPLAKDDPDIMLSGEERGIGGLGIFMVKTMVDEVEYEYRDGRNQLTLRKRL
ncbi:MAG: ATP-binding protein [Clostridia bacterium]|nr:ATP-binding protein [Clostridia bacterium]